MGDVNANIQTSAYFLWIETGSLNALAMRNCARDILKYLFENAVLLTADLVSVLEKGWEDEEYINLVRNIAFRIYCFSGCTDALANWCAAERVLRNAEWRNAAVNAANMLR